MIERLVIRGLRESDAIPPITKLLHEAYAPLAAMGLRYTATYQDDEVTLRRLTRGVAFVGELDEQIVATVTLYPDGVEDGPCEWYRRMGVHYFGQFAVKPDLQRQGLGRRFVQLMEVEAAKRGAEELALDTAEPAHHLREWYERLGYREVELVQWGSTNYRSVILSKSLAPCP
ncbi:GNAT family N-acetyltransferase [Luteolibacter luteus]|nr:GNAT family N-acetyltransferase [Luteolibacter luteus]